MKKNSPMWILVIVAIFVLFVLNIVMSIRTSEYEEMLESLNKTINASFTGKTKTGEDCPDAIGGSEEALLQVKYFYSPFCPWCIKEEPILQKMSSEYGKLIHIRWYNVNNCQELAQQYRVSGVPTLVFSTLNNQTEYSHYGFTAEKDLMKLMCDVSGGC